MIIFFGIGGSLYAHYEHFISPYSFTTGQPFDLVMMWSVGGMGTISGPIVGAIFLTLLSQLTCDWNLKRRGTADARHNTLKGIRPFS